MTYKIKSAAVATAVALTVGSTTVAQQATPVGHPALGGQTISSPSKAQIEAWTKKIREADLASSDDPDYSEFWIELRPINDNDELLPDALAPARPLSPLLVPKSTVTTPVTPGIRPPQLDVTNLLKNKARGPNPTLANWSEEAFGEITDTFAEVVGPDDDVNPNGPLRPANSVLTIRALDRGQRVPKDYYIEILKSVEAN